METGKTGRPSWIDGHVHVMGAGKEGARELSRIEEHYGYTGSSFLSVEGMGDVTQNALGLYYKSLRPAHYAFGGFHYRFDYDFAEELERLLSAGFDGIKMIENKPTVRKTLGFRQDDPRYEKMYSLAEELDVPFLIHVNDPRDFWDPEKCPEWARENGWFYDENYPSYEEILGETENLLRSHPKLRICCAHFLFLSDDEPRLRKLMETCPNLWLDVTAGTEMYQNFGRDPERWRRFFLDFGRRIFYGTDNTNRTGPDDERIQDELNRAEQAAFSSGKYLLWGEELQGLGLPEEILNGLFCENFRIFAGKTPRKVDRSAALEYIQTRAHDPRFLLKTGEKETLADICGTFA